jgi:hypothetical protein
MITGRREERKAGRGREGSLKENSEVAMTKCG